MANEQNQPQRPRTIGLPPPTLTPNVGLPQAPPVAPPDSPTPPPTPKSADPLIQVASSSWVSQVAVDDFNEVGDAGGDNIIKMLYEKARFLPYDGGVVEMVYRLVNPELMTTNPIYRRSRPVKRDGDPSFRGILPDAMFFSANNSYNGTGKEDGCVYNGDSMYVVIPRKAIEIERKRSTEDFDSNLRRVASGNNTNMDPAAKDKTMLSVDPAKIFQQDA